MGTLWIVCAESDHNYFWNHQRLQELQPPPPPPPQLPQDPLQLPSPSEQEHLLPLSLNPSLVSKRSGERKSGFKRMPSKNSNRWVCDVCGKVYERGDSLAHHRSIHKGKTTCPICQIIFSRKYTMREHMAKKHNVMLAWSKRVPRTIVNIVSKRIVTTKIYDRRELDEWQ